MIQLLFRAEGQGLHFAIHIRVYNAISLQKTFSLQGKIDDVKRKSLLWSIHLVALKKKNHSEKSKRGNSQGSVFSLEKNLRLFVKYGNFYGEIINCIYVMAIYFLEIFFCKSRKCM